MRLDVIQESECEVQTPKGKTPWHTSITEFEEWGERLKEDWEEWPIR